MNTTTEVADLYGISINRVCTIARARGIVGRKVGPAYLWTPAQVRKLKPNKPGRPSPKA